MPQVIQKANISLKHLCLQSIAKFIDEIWCADFLQHLFGLSHWLYVVGPFDHIPPSLAHTIFVHLKNHKLLRKHHIYLLISPYAKKLDFSDCVSDLSLLFQLSAQRAKRSVSHLDFSNTKIPKNIFSSTLPELKLIRTLNASHTNIDDDVLGIVGVYCENLIELDISFTSVGDRALITLFTPIDLNGNKNERFGKCQKLAKLSVAGCQKITYFGALQAIDNLANLQVFDYENSVLVINKLCQDQPCFSFKLKSLYNSPDSNDIPDIDAYNSLAIAIKACPDANHVYINVHDHLTVDVPLALLDLPHLKELHIKNEEHIYSLPFFTSCSPVIERHGQTLVSINLAEIEEISVELIRNNCPNLFHLALLWNNSFIHEDEAEGKCRPTVISRNFFPKLLTAKVACKEASEETLFTQIVHEDLVSLLRSPQLKELQLNGCENLSDLAWFEAGESNKLDNLVILELDKCHNVTMEGLEEIIGRNNCLEVLSLMKCEQITKRDIQNYNKKVKRLKWNVKVNWS